jgi:site-specific DNA recombinase
MEKKASMGQWTLGIPPFGYAVDPATRRLRPVPQEGTVVKEVFDLYTTRGMGTRTVANELTRRGYRRRSGRPWSFKTVTDTLRNPAYIGTVALRSVRTEGAHPAIIDRKTFALADALLTERGAIRGKAARVASDYHLTGKIRCPRCGMAYLGTTATGRHRAYRYYTCHTRNRHGTTCCDAPRIDADAFDDQVVAALCDFYSTVALAQRSAEDKDRAVVTDPSAGEQAETDAKGAATVVKPTVASTATTAASRPATQPNRFFGVYQVDATQLLRDLPKLNKEVLAHLIADDIDLKITVEVEAVRKRGFTDDQVRTVGENARALKFDEADFEVDPDR